MLENKRIRFLSKNEMDFMGLKKEDGYYNFDDIKSDREIKYNGPENFVLIHKTNFCPDNDIIKTPKSTGYRNHINWSIKIGEKEYKYVNFDGSNTIHFSVNGEVCSHSAGNWETRQYAIIIPFTEISLEQIAEATSVDTFCVGDVKLTENSYILCPMGTKEELIRNHGIKKAKIIEYPDTYTVTGFANYFIKKIGYNLESANEIKWDSPKSQEQFDRIVKSLGLSNNFHYCSKQLDIDFIDNGVCTIVNIAEIVCTHFKNYGFSDLRDVINCFQNHLSFITYFNENIIDNVSMQERIGMLDSKLLKTGIEVKPEVWQSILYTAQTIGFETEEKQESIQLSFATNLAKACVNTVLREKEETMNKNKR